MNDCLCCHQFLPGAKAISIVSHPPEIYPGTLVTIVNPWIGDLCAVQLPDGMIHRWFTSFEACICPLFLNKLTTNIIAAIVIRSLISPNPNIHHQFIAFPNP